MKLSKYLVSTLAICVLSFCALSQGGGKFSRCSDSFEPAICSAEVLSSEIEELKGYLPTSKVISGTYSYERVTNNELVGKRKIVADGTKIKYFGASGDLYTVFKCPEAQQVCRSVNNDNHVLIIMNKNELYIDWNNSPGGHYRWASSKK